MLFNMRDQGWEQSDVAMNIPWKLYFDANSNKNITEYSFAPTMSFGSIPQFRGSYSAEKSKYDHSPKLEVFLDTGYDELKNNTPRSPEVEANDNRAPGSRSVLNACWKD